MAQRWSSKELIGLKEFEKEKKIAEAVFNPL